MIWLSVRQFRGQALVGAAGLILVAIAFGLTGPGMAHYYSSVVEHCQTRADCDVVSNILVEKNQLLQLLSFVLVLVPGLIGMFWGAPLVARELETGTFRLAWTQSITRTRWLAVKLAVVGLGSVLAAGLFSLMVTWWSTPLDRVQLNRFRPDIFSERGIVAFGYAALAFALGVTAGILIRRTLPAMATTLVGFIAVRLVVQQWVRPHLLSASHMSLPLDQVRMGFLQLSDSGRLVLRAERPDLPNAWVHSASIVDAGGTGITTDTVYATCPQLAQIPNGGPGTGIGQGPVGSKDAFSECITKLSENYHVAVTYQPASQFWTFQALETAIFAALALGLVGFSFWWLRRRLH